MPNTTFTKPLAFYYQLHALQLHTHASNLPDWFIFVLIYSNFSPYLLPCFSIHGYCLEVWGFIEIVRKDLEVSKKGWALQRPNNSEDWKYVVMHNSVLQVA